MKGVLILLVAACGSTSEEPPPLQPPRPPVRRWVAELVDGNAHNVHLADIGGTLAVAYHESALIETRVATDEATGWQIETVDATGGGGAWLAEQPGGGMALGYTTSAMATPAYHIRYATRGGSGFTTGEVTATAQAGIYYNCPTTLAYPGGGNPVIVGCYATPAGIPTGSAIMRWNGSSWDQEIVIGPDAAGAIAATFDAAGNPHLLYSGMRFDTGTSQWFNRPIYGFWSGTAWVWEPLGVEFASNLSFGFGQFSLGIDSTGRVHAVYGHSSSTTTYYYAVRDTSGSWQTESLGMVLGAVLFLDGDSPHLAVAVAGPAIQYRRRGPTGWSIEQSAATGTQPDYDRGVALTIDAAGAPAIAYNDISTHELWVARPPAPAGPPPSGWSCNASFYADGQCDCGCTVADSDCSGGCTAQGCTDHTSTVLGVCQYCWGGTPASGRYDWCGIGD